MSTTLDFPGRSGRALIPGALVFDNFNNNQLDNSRWQNSDPTKLLIQNNRAQWNSVVGNPYLLTQRRFNFTNRYFIMRVFPALSAATNWIAVRFVLNVGFTNWIDCQFEPSNGVFRVNLQPAGTNLDTAWNATTMAWLKVNHRSDTNKFEVWTSPDSTESLTWTLRQSFTPALVVTSMAVWIVAIGSGSPYGIAVDEMFSDMYLSPV